jgi:hypothetical protein
MSVWCRQTTEGEPTQEYVIQPHYAGQTDADLLALKKKGAHEKGWSVHRTGPDSFTVTKDRWGGRLCAREFWVG